MLGHFEGPVFRVGAPIPSTRITDPILTCSCSGNLVARKLE